MSNDRTFVSVIIPCREEAGRIQACLESVVRNNYPKDRLEVLVVDGISEDATRSIVETFAERYSFIRLLENPKKMQSPALNIGIANAKGDVIMRMDAHNEYPEHYISALVYQLEHSGADNVGGLWVTRPANATALARAIAAGLSHPFGVGNAHYRVGVSSPRWVDTVPFGCYRRDLFDRIGMFDEALARNEDDEFNSRLRKNGGRILLVPEVSSYYYARDSLPKLWRMCYQYSYFKPLVARKLGGVATFRQLVPAIFVASLLATAALAPWFPLIRGILAAIILAYAAAVIACSSAVALKRGIRSALGLPLVFPVLHLSYGLGYWKGVLDFLLARRHVGPDVAALPTSR